MLSVFPSFRDSVIEEATECIPCAGRLLNLMRGVIGAADERSGFHVREA